MIILASSSPRRAKLLADTGLEFVIKTKEIDESLIDISRLSPEEAVIKIAKAKVEAVAVDFKEDIIIGADTAVFLDNKIYGKPKDEIDAINMLTELNGKTHNVITGVAIYHNGIIDTFSSKASVTLKKLTEIEIKDYVKTKEPMDKAGAYAIQDQGGMLVEKYDGDFFTIVGLPLKEVIKRINEIQK
ncbi:Maf family protein [Acholeplasma sp. OttesenSCG-928-E16]|nr:Maf family protein [Acholeplasma sp. OttesenSCG-928-E16]